MFDDNVQCTMFYDNVQCLMIMYNVQCFVPLGFLFENLLCAHCNNGPCSQHPAQEPQDCPQGHTHSQPAHGVL